MRGRAVWAVLRKELRETLRDRRTLLVMIVVPVLLYPAMMVMMEQMAVFGQRSLEAAAVRVAVVNGPPGDEWLAADDVAIRTSRAETPPLGALRAAEVDAVVVFPEGAWREDDTNVVRIHYDGTRERSSYAHGLVQRRLAEWGDTVAAQRFRARGLPPALARPVRVEAESVASAEEVGGYMLGRFLPLLLILMTVLGAFYPSIDLAAGEKERGTLEALLTVPVPADHLVAGKFIAAALMGLTAAALNLGSMLLTFQAGVIQFGDAVDIQFQVPLRSVLVILAVLALLAVLFSSLFLGIAVRSHSFKEAQNALTPVYILSLVPAMLPMMPGLEFSTGFALVPVAGVGFLFRDLMSGSVAMGPAVVAVAATAGYAGLALVYAARAFGREDVLFGTGGGAAAPVRRRWFGPRADGAPAVPSATVALGLAGVCALLFFYGARPLGMRFGEAGILISQWAFLALPALLLVGAGRYSARQTLALRAPGGRALAGAVLVAAGGMPIGWLIAWLQGFVLEIPWEFLEAMQRMLAADSAGRLFWLLLVVAVTPAICEELVFRGVLLQGLRTRLSPWGAIAASALVFGAFHLSFETAIRLLPTAWLGLLLAYVVWRTGSIFTGMLMHLVNNGTIVLLLFAPGLMARLGEPGAPPPWLAVLLAPVLLWAGLRLLPSTPASEPPSTQM
ncbi:MAG TPA: ABC transporter permease subunit/CPBP intramembrane protease [Longimicrobiales bacterium]|nr:ABC transporter permease subunit/CPBP intramembrane protease [Longimicrobiales bacterium]